MKSIIASGLLLGMAHGAAQAGPYVNVEANSGFTGSDYTGTATTDVHVGYEGANWYWGPRRSCLYCLLMVVTLMWTCLVKQAARVALPKNLDLTVSVVCHW